MRQISYQDYRALVCDVEEKDPKFINTRPVVIDFFAQWCGPCKAMEPTLRNVSVSFEEDVDFYKIDVDDDGASKLATIFKIRSIPTMVYIKPGGEYFTTVGALPEGSIREKIKTVFGL